ncbi:MAG: hypothetical protein ABUT20_62360 [Bacteroidota bacterium]
MNRLNDLIEKGKEFSFDNNSKLTGSEHFSKASDEFLAWIAGIEDFLVQNYDEESGPFRLFKTLERDKLTGHYQSSFEEQLGILRGTLLSCKDITPYKRTLQNDNTIISLLKNPVFWTVIAIVIAGSFPLGLYIGNARFDNNLIELSESKRELQDSVKIKNRQIKSMKHNSDSALNILGHMPYSEMNLDTLSFHKVQTTIENVGAALYLNK